MGRFDYILMIMAGMSVALAFVAALAWR